MLESQVEALIDLRQLKLLLMAFAVKQQKLEEQVEYSMGLCRLRLLLEALSANT